MNTQEMLRIIDSIARDRNVDRDMLLQDLEMAMVSAARKHFNTLDTEEFQCEVDKLTGEIRLFRHGAPLEIPPEAFGRIAAQTFKQVMIQKFREDERTSLYEEFSKRVGEISTGVAQRYEGGALVVTIDRAEGFMPRSEQIPGEQFQPGDRIRCLILDVRDVGNQVKIVLSRSHPDFIKRLFEVEVPEVSERVIELKAMAREAGYRTKVAVSSIDSKVDAVGACVGVRGSRIKNIVDELNGEKIDIVRWNESSQVLIQNALKPAEVAEISLCFELGRATVVVNEDQLSLAIGKRGQNVRLAARLTGWDIDILTPVEFNKGLEAMAETLEPIEGVTEEMLDKLAALGFVSVFDVEEAGAQVLIDELEMPTELAETVINSASEKAKIVAEQQAREKAEAEKRRVEEEAAARRMLEGEGDGGEISSDIAAAAILSAGGMPREVITDPESLERLSADADARADAILSGAEVAPAPADETEERKKDEPDAGYDPDESADAPTDSESDSVQGGEIVEGAIRDVLDRSESRQSNS
ncbi:MAG: transcription termination/antitermination protein NusA [Phycisphaeraceae bacterium]|nr:MAG: transcription termination/antitermination protein NusA [Phycisphaeraceae bacterium]